MNTDRIASFVSAAEAGSLSRGAERLGVQLSGVSRHVTELEQELGVRLFERTGRGVRVTAAGERFLERGRTILLELEQARAELRESPRAREPSLLRLSASPDFALQVMPAVIATLVTEHPQLTVELRGEVRQVSLVEESYDAAVRLGPLRPSALIATHVGLITGRLYAPPGVRVTSLKELSALEFSRVHGMPAKFTARLRGKPVTIEPRGRVRLNSFFEAADVAARTGRVVLLPSIAAGPWVAAGKLKPVLEELHYGPADVHLMRAPRHRGSAILGRLAALLTEALQEAERPTAPARRSRG